MSTEELMLLTCGVGEDSRVPWTARRSKPSTLKEIHLKIFIGRTNAEAETQYIGHLMWKGGKKHQRSDSMEKTLMLGKIEGRMRRGRRRAYSAFGHKTNVHFLYCGYHQIFCKRIP